MKEIAIIEPEIRRVEAKIAKECPVCQRWIHEDDKDTDCYRYVYGGPPRKPVISFQDAYREAMRRTYASVIGLELP